MKTKYFLPVILITVFTLSACEDILNENDTFNTVQRLEGLWQCDDDVSIVKSAMLKYQVYITPSESDSTEIILNNFHSLGNNVDATGRVSGSTITIPQQTLLGGYTVKGSGTISSNVKEISWKYFIDDGSGQEEQVTAVYTFMY